MNKEQITERTISSLAKHPYLWMLGLCLLIDPFFFGSVGNIPNNALMLECFGLFGAAVIFSFRRYDRGELSKPRLCVFMICILSAVLLGAISYTNSQNKAIWHFFGGCILIFTMYYFTYMKKFRGQLNSVLIIGLGFMIKLHYILVTSVYTRQHDVFSFDSTAGHAGYIEYLLQNHHLSDFDPRDRWQFVHPPLHHAISSLWIYLNENIFHVGHDPARESLQTLTLFYSMCIIVSAYKIFKCFGLNGRSLYIPLMIVSFHPAFILLSGSINNDVLSAALVMGAVVCTLEWYREQTLKNILKIALCIGLAMMAKISAATIAPPVALVFLIVFIRKFRTNGKSLFGQFCAFGTVCIPLGLWFGIRNYIKWKIPLTYVSEMDKNCEQYIGDRTLLQRITDFSAYQFSSPYEQWAWLDDTGKMHGYNEFNPLTTLLKNSIFGEFINEGCFTWTYTNTFARVLFWVNILLAGAALVLMLFFCIKKPNIPKLFFAAFHITIMVSFFKAAADYAFTCTMNFRYITPTVITGAVFIGMAASEDNIKNNIIISKLLTVTSVLFSLMTALVYTALL